MKQYVFEHNWDVEIFTEEKKAIDTAEILWDRMTEKERKECAYFQVYEIETKSGADKIEGDLKDYCTREIKDFKLGY